MNSRKTLIRNKDLKTANCNNNFTLFYKNLQCLLISLRYSNALMFILKLKVNLSEVFRRRFQSAFTASLLFSCFNDVEVYNP